VSEPMTDWVRKCCGTPADEPHMFDCYMISVIEVEPARLEADDE